MEAVVVGDPWWWSGGDDSSIRGESFIVTFNGYHHPPPLTLSLPYFIPSLFSPERFRGHSGDCRVSGNAVSTNKVSFSFSFLVAIIYVYHPPLLIPLFPVLCSIFPLV